MAKQDNSDLDNKRSCPPKYSTALTLPEILAMSPSFPHKPRSRQTHHWTGFQSTPEHPMRQYQTRQDHL